MYRHRCTQLYDASKLYTKSATPALAILFLERSLYLWGLIFRWCWPGKETIHNFSRRSLFTSNNFLRSSRPPITIILIAIYPKQTQNKSYRSWFNCIEAFFHSWRRCQIVFSKFLFANFWTCRVNAVQTALPPLKSSGTCGKATCTMFHSHSTWITSLPIECS